MFFRNVEVEVCVSWGSEGVITATLPTQKMAKTFSGEKFRGVEDGVFQQVGQACQQDIVKYLPFPRAIYVLLISPFGCSYTLVV